MICKFEFESKIEIFKYISLGLTEGTSESDVFQEAYTKSNIEVQKKRNF